MNDDFICFYFLSDFISRLEQGLCRLSNTAFQIVSFLLTEVQTVSVMLSISSAFRHKGTTSQQLLKSLMFYEM